MGSGKTTIGRLVAQELGLEFRDCDQELEKMTGASVNLIFDVEGEAGFRERESQLLAQLSTEKGILVATGGGVVKHAENRKILRRSGLVVWLKVSVDQQLSRLSHGQVTTSATNQEPRFQAAQACRGARSPLHGNCRSGVHVSQPQLQSSCPGALSTHSQSQAKRN